MTVIITFIVSLINLINSLLGRNLGFIDEETKAPIRKFDQYFNQNGEQILNCDICYDHMNQSLLIGRFCSNNACSTCWEKLLEKGKCPFCCHEVSEEDLIKNRTAEHLKEMMEAKSKLQTDYYTCETHNQSGCLYCETGDEFICKKGVFFGTHQFHNFRNIEGHSDIILKKQEMNEVEHQLRILTENYREVKNNCSEFYDLNFDQLQVFISKLRERMINKIDSEIQMLNWKASQAITSLGELKTDYKNLLIANKIIREKIDSGKYNLAPKLLRQEAMTTLRDNKLSKIARMIEKSNFRTF